jgi:hypothetical protein
MAALDHRTMLLPFAVGDTPGCALHHLTPAHWSVRVWGNLGPFWADAFSLGLASAGISIRRGFARQDGAGRWIADFLLSPGADAPDPASLDFLSLAVRAAASDDGGEIVLSHYALDGGPDVGPGLYLEVRGPDRLGFLGSLLRSLARLELSPREMMITTREDEAFDRFFLKTVSGAVPSEEARRALEEVLDAAVLAHVPPPPSGADAAEPARGIG